MNKLLLTVSLTFFAALLFAQANYQYTAEIAGINNAADVKKASFIMAQHQSLEKLSWSDDHQFVKLESNSALSHEALHLDLVAGGYYLLELELILPQDGNTKYIPGFPQMQHTGDPGTDALNYSLAKDQWIQENPELYQQLTAPDTQPAPTGTISK